MIFANGNHTGFAHAGQIVLGVESVTDSITIEVGWNAACIESVRLTANFIHASPTVSVTVNVDASTPKTNLVEDIQVVRCAAEFKVRSNPNATRFVNCSR